MSLDCLFLMFGFGLIVMLVLFAIIVFSYEDRHFKVRNRCIGILFDNKTNKISRYQIYNSDKKYSKKINEKCYEFPIDEMTIDRDISVVTSHSKQDIIRYNLVYKYNFNDFYKLIENYGNDSYIHKNKLAKDITDIIRYIMLNHTLKELYDYKKANEISESCLKELKELLKTKTNNIEIISLKISPNYYD